MFRINAALEVGRMRAMGTVAATSQCITYTASVVCSWKYLTRGFSSVDATSSGTKMIASDTSVWRDVQRALDRTRARQLSESYPDTAHPLLSHPNLDTVDAELADQLVVLFIVVFIASPSFTAMSSRR